MRLRGFTVEEVMYQPLDRVLTPESYRLALAVYDEEMKLEASGTADPGRMRIVEVEEYTKDGSVIWVEAGLSFLRGGDGRPSGILMVSPGYHRPQKVGSGANLTGQNPPRQRGEVPVPRRILPGRHHDHRHAGKAPVCQRYRRPGARSRRPRLPDRQEHDGVHRAGIGERCGPGFHGRGAGQRRLPGTVLYDSEFGEETPRGVHRQADHVRRRAGGPHLHPGRHQPQAGGRGEAHAGRAP